MTVKSIVLCPIVGAFYRPPAKTILSLLPVGHELILEPEPDNQYDPLAIKVGVRLSSIDIGEDDFDAVENELVKYGYDWDRLHLDEYGVMQEDPIFQLGYIPRSGTKTAKIDGEPAYGNAEVLNIIRQPNWKATLTYSPMSQTLVQIVTNSDE